MEKVLALVKRCKETKCRVVRALDHLKKESPFSISEQTSIDSGVNHRRETV